MSITFSSVKQSNALIGGPQNGASISGAPYGFGTMGIPGTGGDFSKLSPSMRNPLLNTTNFYLPQDRRVLNQWYRYYDKFDAFIGNSLDLHSQTVVSPCDLMGIEDKSIMRVYESMWEKLDVVNNLRSMVREWFLIGEVFPFLQWNETTGTYDSLTIIDPDLVELKYHPFIHIKDAVSFEITPPPQLKEFIESADPVDQQLCQFLPPKIRESASSGQPIKVSPFNMTGIMRKASPYDQRGTSIVLRALKYLMYGDKLMESNYAIAEGHVMPRWIFKLGDQANKIPPKAKDLRAFRDQLMKSWFDHHTAIVSTYALQVEAIGSAGKILPLVPEYNWVQEMVLTAMFTTKLATTGEGPTYQNSSVAREIVNARYNSIRQAVCENWVKNKLFAPVAKAHGWYHPEDKDLPKSERRLWLPELNWKGKLDLTDTQEFREWLFKLKDTFGVSSKTIYKSLGLDYEEEEKNIKNEFGTVFDPVYNKYREGRAQKKLEEIGTDMQGGGVGPDVGSTPGAGGAGGESDIDSLEVNIDAPEAPEMAPAPTE